MTDAAQQEKLAGYARMLKGMVESINPKTKNFHLAAINFALRTFMDDETAFPNYWSEAAWAKARELGIPEAGKKTWKSQNKWDPGRKNFINEHMLPINTIVERLIADPTKAYDILLTAKQVWVTRAEDAKLKTSGWSKRRPEDAYAQLGIKVRE